MNRDHILPIAAAALSGIAGALGAVSALGALRRRSTDALGSCREQLATLGNLRLVVVRELVERLEGEAGDFRSLSLVSLLDLPAAAAGAFSNTEWEQALWEVAQEDAVTAGEVTETMKRHGLEVGAVVPQPEEAS